jgi:hypothetical protein
LSRLAHELDDGVYWRSWYDNAQPGAEVAEADASGAGLTSHL